MGCHTRGSTGTSMRCRAPPATAPAPGHAAAHHTRLAGCPPSPCSASHHGSRGRGPGTATMKEGCRAACCVGNSQSPQPAPLASVGMTCLDVSSWPPSLACPALSAPPRHHKALPPQPLRWEGHFPPRSAAAPYPEQRAVLAVHSPHPRGGTLQLPHILQELRATGQEVWWTSAAGRPGLPLKLAR